MQHRAGLDLLIDASLEEWLSLWAGLPIASCEFLSFQAASSFSVSPSETACSDKMKSSPRRFAVRLGLALACSHRRADDASWGFLEAPGGDPQG